MNKKYDLEGMAVKLKKYLDIDRYTHTIGVMYTSAALAMAYDYDLESAQVAGLLHDCAKCIPNKKKLKMCSEGNITITELEERNPFLLHAKLGAYVAKENYQIYDEEILSAITYHTTGKPDMSRLEKIIFIADYIEPKRDKALNLAKIRYTAFRDLDECIYEILKETLAYLENNPIDIDTTTVDAYAYYQNVHQYKEKGTIEYESR